jgi:hypothetical protein
LEKELKEYLVKDRWGGTYGEQYLVFSEEAVSPFIRKVHCGDYLRFIDGGCFSALSFRLDCLVRTGAAFPGDSGFKTAADL